MDELKQGMENSLSGEEKEKILVDIRNILDEWRIVMPDVEPLVFDFGAGSFHEIGETEFWITNEKDAGYCGKFMFLFQGQMCPEHYHNTKLETFYILRGRIEMNYHGNTTVMQPGDVLNVETGKKHSFKGISNALVLEISMPSIISDNYFTDGAIGYKYRS